MTEPLSDVVQGRLERQVDAWRRDLLTIDRRQRLLYFKHTRTASLEIDVADLARSLTMVQGGRVGIVPLPEDGDDLSPRPDPTRQLVVKNKTPADLPAALRRLDQQSQQVYADRGFWTLYLALGMLRWLDPETNTPVDSPVVLVPVQLVRGAADRPYGVRRTEDEILVNPALGLQLERDFKIVLPAIEEDDVDVRKLLERVVGVVGDRPGWRVDNRAVMTTFSFHKEAIYRDLQDHEEQVAAHPLVRLMALGLDAPTADDHSFEPVQEDQLDSTIAPERLMSILDADGSQRQCILAARSGKSFVMDGPPGTGKSQTITNIIAELMAMGKTVLFVSEKAAALDVVHKRLATAGLTEFVLELHSHAATRKQVVKEFDDALSRRPRAVSGFGQSDKAALVDTRELLSAYSTAMNEERLVLGRTLHSVLGRLSELHDYEDCLVPANPSWARLSSQHLAEVISSAEALARSWRPIGDGENFLWRGLAEIDDSSANIQRLSQLASAVARASELLASRLREVDRQIGTFGGMSIDEAGRRVSLLHEIANHPDIPPAWFVVPELVQLNERIGKLRTATDSHRRAAVRLHDAVGGKWMQLESDHLLDAQQLVDDGDVTRWYPRPFANASSLASLVNFLESGPQRLVEMQKDSHVLASIFRAPAEQLSPARSAQLAGLGQLTGSATLPDERWLHPAVQPALRESQRVLGELVSVVRERENALTEVFTKDALALDLPALQVRFRDSHRGFRRFSGAARADRRTIASAAVSGRATKGVLAHLDEAVAWQRADRALAQKEPDLAPVLGEHYRRVDTDFSRLATAISVAQEALRLAGDELTTKSLADQLGRDSTPDPATFETGERLGRVTAAWYAELERHLGQTQARALMVMPFGEVGQWLSDTAARLRPGVAAVHHVAMVAERDVTIEEATELLATAGLCADVVAQMSNQSEQDADLLGRTYLGLDTDWDGMEAAVRWAERVRRLLGGPVQIDVASNLRQPMMDAAEVEPLVEAYQSARNVLCACFVEDRASRFAVDLNEDLADAHELATEMARTASTDVAELAEFVKARDWLVGCGFESPLGLLFDRRLSAGAVADSIEHAALQAWTDAILESDVRLRQYRGTDRDALVLKFRSLDRRLVGDAHSGVIEQCSARRPTAPSRQAQRIRREGQKKSRHLPIRQLLAEAGAVAQELKPCFMMSPLSASQFLPAELRFDTVIFDEASQVLPSDAINCVYRGRQLIIAGDQKQLPPTSFFARAVDEDALDDDAPDSFPSLLDLCKGTAGMASLPLTWHYRSRHEALIAYSNHGFYEGKLSTFPGAVAEAPDLGVQAYFVDGVYRRGGSRDNPIEAEAVVDRVLYHRRKHEELSLGVVTFSVAQEDTIRATIERRAMDEPELSKLLYSHDRLEGFFVKNLENVQGDERDVVIFSVGYGPDEEGVFKRNLGPLGQRGGERRLNVAITRARQRVEIVSSIRPEMLGQPTAEGVRHLQAYLDFAERGATALEVAPVDDVREGATEVLRDVDRVLRSWGYSTVLDVGMADYRVGIGVRHPDREQEFVLAVEADGPSYFSAKSARDRDRLRESVLTGLGWRVHRVWSAAWVRDRAGEETRLLAAVDAGVDASRAPTVPADDSSSVTITVEDVDFEAPPSWALPYKRYDGFNRSCPYELHEPEARSYLRRYFERALTLEAPVHEQVLMRTFRDDWGIGRIGHRIRENVNLALSSISVDGARITRDRFGFFRIAGSGVPPVRVPADEISFRAPEHLPPEEVDVAIAHLVADARQASHEDLIEAVSRLFAWRRRQAEAEALVTASTSRLVAAGVVAENEDGLLRSTPRWDGHTG